MSVILTACRKTKQKQALENAKERAKKAAEKKRQQKEAKWTEGGMHEYSTCPSVLPDTKTWSFELSSDYYYIIFYKYSGEVYVNDEKVDAIDTGSDDGLILDFELNGHKARIHVTPDGDSQVLTVNGHPVAE